MGSTKTAVLLAAAVLFPLKFFAATPSISIAPGSTEVRAGTTKQFTANVRNLSGTSVTWLVNDIVGGNASVGTINSAGLYTAPAVLPASNIVRVKARSTVNTSVSGTSTVTLLNPRPNIDLLIPTGINHGAFRLTMRGTGFVRGAKVAFGGTQLTTTFVSSTELQLSGNATAAAGTRLPLSVTNPNPGSSSTEWQLTVLPPANVNILKSIETLNAGESMKFDVHIGYLSIDTLKWKVNGIDGGNSTVGTVTSGGVYKAPAIVPANNNVTLSATSTYYSTATDTAKITILQSVPAITSLSPSSVTLGTRTITANGSGFVPTSQVLYAGKVVPVKYVSSTKLEATVTAAPLPGGMAAVRVRNPDPGSAISKAVPLSVTVANPKVSYLAAVRFLRQASFGPTPDSIARVQELGFDGWLNEQRGFTDSTYPNSGFSTEVISVHRAHFFINATAKRDQLRQRMAFALGQLFVTSGTKVGRSIQMIPYQRLLLDYAFHRFRTTLRAVALSPTMGRYLDMVNNDRSIPGRSQLPNENFARELLQLFTIGTVQLNADGSPKAGNPPAYGEQDVEEFARALTGWTFPVRPGATPQMHNPEYYEGRMIAWEANHDSGAKTLLRGMTLQAGQTASQDLEDVLQNLSEHPNTAPFVSTRLIRHFVTSNPSPAYIQRVASVFKNSDQDLFAVLRAVLLDPEARAGDAGEDASPDTSGHLLEPVLFATNAIRAVGATLAANNVVPQNTNAMGQNLYYPPSVFNYFSPLSRLPNGSLVGPEFQILTPSTAVMRVNFLYGLFGNYHTGITVPITNFREFADNPSVLVEAAGRTLLGAPVPTAVRDMILPAVTSTNDMERRAVYALYLVASSGLSQVAH